MELPVTHTIDDIYALPDGERAKLIDGNIYYMSPPSRKHQEIAGELFGTIRDYIKFNHGSCRPDYFTKLFKYRTVGVREYWIVDSDKNRVMVYTFEMENMSEYTFTDSIPVNIYPGYSINFSQRKI